MAKTKQPDNESRPGVDYYEYKQMQETARLRRRALEATPQDVRRKNEPAHKTKMRAIAKIADEDIARDGVTESIPREQPTAPAPQPTAPVSQPVAPAPQPVAPAPQPVAPAPQPVVADGDSAEEPQLIYQDPESLNAPVDKGYDENDVEITNPFADALAKIRQLSGRLLRRRVADGSGADQIDGDDQGSASQSTAHTRARLKNAGRPGAASTSGDDDDEDDEDIDRRSLRKAAQAVHAVANDADDEDPLGVMRPNFDADQRAYMRPRADDDDLHRSVTRANSQRQRGADEVPQGEPTLTAKLLDDLENIPALSRRERKALASAGTLGKAAVRKPTDSDDGLPVIDGSIDEPTQQFMPLRFHAAKPAAREVREADAREDERISASHISAPVDDDDDYLDDEDDEDDYEDDDFDVRSAPSRRFGRKQRVYRDEEYEGDEDDYGEDDYDDEDDYDGDYDEDDEDYDDYDEEEALNRYHVSFGKRMLALIKGLLIVVLMFLLVVVALRQLETSGKLKLDFIRDTVGQMLPIELLLPTPSAAPVEQRAVEDEPQPSADIDADADVDADLVTPEPSIAPDDSEGRPLDDFVEDDEMQGMDDYDELEGYSDISGEDDEDPDAAEADGAQVLVSFA